MFMEILLKNGLVYDGSKNNPIVKDIYINNGVIKEIGNELMYLEAKVIDCTNLVVTPGFIDAHSHNDFFVMENEEENNLPFLRQGITTQVVGNCGFSAYGISKDSNYKDLIGGGLFKVKNPGSLREFSKALEGKLIHNLIPLIGHGTTRISTVGKSSKPLTKEELDSELSLLEEGFKDGAFGGSFGLMYEPGMFAPKEELIRFAEVIKKHDGILTIHPRANSKIALGYPLISKPHIEIALDEMIEIMEATNVRVENSHLIFVGKSSWKCVDPMLKKFYKAREKGYDIAYDIYPFTYGASVITVILPSWYLKLTIEERKKPFNRFKLKLIINITKKLLGIEFSDLLISYIGKDYPQYEGKNVYELAKLENLKPIDMYLKLVDLSNGEGRIMLGKYYSEEIIRKLMLDDLSIYMTDAWYETSGTQNAGAFQAFPFFLQKTKEYNIPLQNTIHKMTGLTADRFGVKERGYIKEGYAADITIFDYDLIKTEENTPDQTPTGIKHVIINGEIALSNNEYKGVKKGIILKKIKFVE
jgi:N-acyl-D-amino-acid deacylase